jgi:hypothetical protein
MRSLVLYLLLIILPCIAFGQSIRGGLAAGMNAAQVDGDEVYGYHKYGLNAGAFATIPVGKNFSVSIETSYSQKGSYQSPQYADSLSGEYKLILNYVEVPVLFQYTDKDIVKVGTGLSWGRLVQFKEYEHGNRVVWPTSYGPYKTSDTQILVDLQLKLFTGFYFNLRYGYSLGKIRTRTFVQQATGKTWTRKQYNNDLTARLIYVFKDSKTIKEKKATVSKKVK